MDIKKLQKLLIKHEGVRSKIYQDSLGFWTIGVGRNLTSKGISTATINQMLIEDTADTINFLNSNLPWWTELDDVRQIALADMTFNLMGRILGFKDMLTALKAKEWDKAADELLDSMFAHQVGQRAKDLAFMIRTGQDA